jgi:hypothetical protein
VSGGGGKEGAGARVCVAAGQYSYICTSKASKLSTCVATKEGKEVLGGGAEAAGCAGGSGPPDPAAALRVMVSVESLRLHTLVAAGLKASYTSSLRP